MQSGIGRAGFLLLALVVFAVGAFGFALTWAAFKASATTFFWMGLGVAGAAMLLLYLFASFATGTGQPKAPAPATPTPMPAPKPEAKPAKAQDYEFTDYRPAPKAAPEDLVLPPAFQDARPPGAEAAVEFQATPKAQPARDARRDPAAWPGQKGQSAWSHHVDHRRRVEGQVDDSRRRHEMADRYTTNTPTMRAILEEKPKATPERLADRAPRDMNTDFVAPGMSIGQCGQCKTLLLAPEERPLRLKCPECAKVTLLE